MCWPRVAFSLAPAFPAFLLPSARTAAFLRGVTFAGVLVPAFGARAPLLLGEALAGPWTRPRRERNTQASPATNKRDSSRAAV